MSLYLNIMESYFGIFFCFLQVLPSSTTTTMTCLNWTSSVDDVYRSHCYWYENVSKSLSFFEADDYCSAKGGRLAPYVDSMQYTTVEHLRHYPTSDTFFGVIDVGKNNLWTQLDGTVIDSSFTSTFDGSTGQPNGGSSQNCIVINAEPSSTHAPDKTQDKACSSSYKTKSMLCYIDTKEFCFGWTSTADNIVREHCYWLITKPKSSSQWNVVDALYRCTSEGGTLAPAIDTVQMSFIKESLTSIFESSTVTKTGVWMGSNTIRGKEWNWDNQPNFLSSTSTGSITPEKCMRLEKDSLNTGYINCRSDSTSVRGAVCARYGTGNIVIEHVPSSSAPTVTNTTTSTTTLKATTTTTTTTTPEPETTVTPASTNAPCVARSDVYNLTSVETIKMALTVDPKETTAYKSTLTCAEDDRVVSRYIGYTGVFTISTVMASFIFMDCIRICTGC